MTYRILCDENVEAATVGELERHGITATHVNNEPGNESPDETVVRYANENDYLVLTNDDDFLVTSDFPDVTVLYHPDNSVSAHALASRVADLRSWVPDPTDLGRVTFLTE